MSDTIREAMARLAAHFHECDLGLPMYAGQRWDCRIRTGTCRSLVAGGYAVIAYALTDRGFTRRVTIHIRQP